MLWKAGNIRAILSHKSNLGRWKSAENRVFKLQKKSKVLKEIKSSDSTGFEELLTISLKDSPGTPPVSDFILQSPRFLKSFFFPFTKKSK